MATRNELRNDLARALIEWRDAGGPVDAVVDSIDGYMKHPRNTMSYLTTGSNGWLILLGILIGSVITRALGF